MKQLHLNALSLIMARIKNCGKGLKTSQDPYSTHYWNQELNKANLIKSYIENRLDKTQNVIYVDFTAKKRVA